MAINNAAVLTTDTEILTVPASKKYAITTLLVCNVGTDDGTGVNDTTFDMHVIKDGQVKANTNLVLNKLPVTASETFTFNVERIILEENDK